MSDTEKQIHEMEKELAELTTENQRLREEIEAFRTLPQPTHGHHPERKDEK